MDGRLQRWQASSPVLQLETEVHESTVACCAWSPDGCYIATGAFDGKVRVWSAEDMKLKTCEFACESRVNICRFSPDGRHLIVGEGWGAMYAVGSSGALSIYEAMSGKKLCSFPFPVLVNAFAIASPDLQIAVANAKRIDLLRVSGIEVSPPIVVPTRYWRFADEERGSGRWDMNLSLVCWWCGHNFPSNASDAKLARMSTSNNQRPAGCPSCGRPLSIAPFVVDQHLPK
jgi:WD40 repeat protein